MADSLIWIKNVILYDTQLRQSYDRKHTDSLYPAGNLHQSGQVYILGCHKDQEEQKIHGRPR